jgi:DNA gyrase subunit A
MTAPLSPSPETLPNSSGERIVDVELTDEMEGSFLEYAYSVIYQRALPDARDGLKPVQRRIIYQMAQMGLSPEKGHVKSARVVGDVMGKLHPHGDSAIYDALVRLAQPFSMRIPMVDGHGNFGSLDDGPAAARYTEARLRPEAMAMVQDLDEDVVDFVPNYDNQLTQPSVLPAAFPSLLVNGASGIAVGMATNMAPHNLGEVIEAVIHLIENPDATLDELMEYVPGPDLPTGGIIVGSDGIKDAYASGRGSFKMRATVAIEQIGPRKTGLVVTELPYLVGPERVIDKIKDAVGSKKLAGISDVTDLTDRHHGLRMVIGIKSGFDPEAVLGELYRLTPLEENFSINSVALVEGQPKTLGLTELLRVYIDHRISVVTRRSVFRLDQRKKRLHLVEGLLVAILDIDEVIQVIRASDDSASAKKRLQEVFDLTDIQTEYILELKLRRLTKFSRVELEAERDHLVAEITQLKELLGRDDLIRMTVSTELSAVASTFDTPRRSRLNGVALPAVRSAKNPPTLEISDAPCSVLVSASGRAARVTWPEDGPLAPSKRTPHDGLLSHLHGRLRGKMGAVTSEGTVHLFTPMDLPDVAPEKPLLAQGVDVREFLGLSATAGNVVGVFALEEEPTIMLGTSSGVVKRVSLSGLPDRPVHSLISLKETDSVVGASVATDEAQIVLITDSGQLLNFPASAVRPQGLTAAGMAGIALPEGARVIWAGAHDRETHQVVTLSGSRSVLPGTEALRIKRTPLSEFPAKGRATGGVRAHTFLKGEDVLLRAFVGVEPMLLGPTGKPLDMECEPAKRDASGTPLDHTVGFVGEALR